jgi:two-component system cell cycle sensor histidine kinase/response regulator CckA
MPVEDVPQVPRRGSGTILVVEDEEPVRQLILAILDSCGFTVLEAAGGHEALETAANYGGPIDLLITDLEMPRMRGTELAGKISATRPEIRTLFISGYSEAEIGKRGDLKTGTAFLAKPFRSADLTAKVLNALSGN